MKKASVSVLLSAEAPISFKGYRFPPDIISYAVWVYCWSALSSFKRKRYSLSGRRFR
ncbi:transposase-like protein [Paraburkholderia sp. MM5496-R1]